MVYHWLETSYFLGFWLWTNGSNFQENSFNPETALSKDGKICKTGVSTYTSLSFSPKSSSHRLQFSLRKKAKKNKQSDYYCVALNGIITLESLCMSQYMQQHTRKHGYKNINKNNMNHNLFWNSTRNKAI